MNSLSKESKTVNTIVPKCLFHSSNDQSSFSRMICLSENCDVRCSQQKISGKSKEGSARILCSECLDQQRHAGHVILNFTKFTQMVNQYRVESQKSCKIVLQKFAGCRKEINELFDQFQEKIRNVLTFDYSLPQGTHEQIVIQKSSHNIQMSTKISNLSHWNDILRVKKIGGDAGSIIHDILGFKEDIVCDQIQNMSELFSQNIVDSMGNIQFITMNKNLIFNPDDMHSTGVGLTLNRNTLEAVEADGNNIISSMCKNQESESTVAFTGCKVAFTEVSCRSDLSKSFKIKGINTKLLIGCVDEQSHQLIGEQFLYEYCEKLIYGISICKDGEVIAYNKVGAPIVIPQVIIKEGDIIQMTIHMKQNSVVFIRYHSPSPEEQNVSEIGCGKNMVYSSMLGDFRKHIIATINLEPLQTIQQNYYCFAGVAREGDEIQLVDNIVLIRRYLDNYAKNTEQSIEVDDKDCIQILTYLQGVGDDDQPKDNIDNFKI